MTIRTRILLVYLLIIGGGYLYLVGWILDSIRPRYLESMEESLVDTANILAAIVEQRVAATPDATSTNASDPLAATSLRQLFDTAYHRVFNAQIYSILKTDIDLRIYVTGADGIVRYDSDHGRDEGADYSRWLDVSKTLRGEYGARATRDDPDRDYSLAIYVAAPIRSPGGDTIGVLTVSKPTRNINELVGAARNRVLIGGMIGGAFVLVAGVAFSVWITTPLQRLTAYARAVRDGRPASLPRLAGREVDELRHAFEEMRTALEGKDYVERYTQTLAHEIKAPLSAIRGAAELLTDDKGAMPAAQRERFLGNLQRESARIQQIVDKLLQLAALESRAHLPPPSPVDLRALVREAVSATEPARVARRIALTLTPAPAQESPDATAFTLTGEKFLLTQALVNLLQNAIDFSPPGGAIMVTLTTAPVPAGGAVTRAAKIVTQTPSPRHRFSITIDDTGPGIPDYAQERVFERFYSLPRPESGAKSTGLGLSFVREVAHLHGGDITLQNRPEGGCRATLTLEQ
ncbi:two-component system sensor histidine kinase CreC [Geminisphaera colitermitum]|uniref:two-component system sensor histidine kinase CreC n=1 Tax=Geminisphaera colitermitum TaxID=1148786 RepID=UPI000158C82A|nr:two-component system sensor histidine kinase CreC [Geminisphaera colitermitum]